MLNKSITAVAIAFGISMASSPAFAGTDTQTLNVTAVNSAMCSMGIPGDIYTVLESDGGSNRISQTSISELTVVCNNLLPYTVEITTDDAAGNFKMTDDATSQQINARARVSGEGADVSGNPASIAWQSWGTVANNAALNAVGTGETQTFATRVDINTDNTYAAVGTYTKSLEITLNY
ncbi:hypothetical protein [Xanthomonas axonopodis]